MVLRLLAAPAEHWLGDRLNDYLRDGSEYRSITRSLLHFSGQITYAPAAITVTLDRPAPPRLACALASSSPREYPAAQRLVVSARWPHALTRRSMFQPPQRSS